MFQIFRSEPPLSHTLCQLPHFELMQLTRMEKENEVENHQIKSLLQRTALAGPAEMSGLRAESIGSLQPTAGYELVPLFTTKRTNLAQ